MNDLARVVEIGRRELAPVLHLSGNILYSAASTLRPGRVYLLGLNPGGDPARHESIGAMLDALSARTTNAYVDECWERRSQAGEAPLQRRVQWLARELGIDVRTICAANLIFRRTKAAADIDFPVWADLCWPVHDAILQIVRPALIISIGNSRVSAYAYVRQKWGGRSEHRFPAGHGSWQCRAFRSGTTTVVGLHLSRYAADRHPAVALWLRTLLS